MNHLCPICNGLARLAAECQKCGGQLVDEGRLYDYYGDYSPYREIDDAKMDNGLPDRLNHLCIHAGWCPVCRSQQSVFVQEWNEQTALLIRSPEVPDFHGAERVQ